MTPERQRIVIAEVCGWTCCGQVPGLHPHGLAPWLKVSDYTSEQVLNHEVPIDTLPDYLGNLNAMHQAESHLGCVIDTDGTLEFAYELQLIKVMKPSGWRIYYATAAQRAEAFLKTLNKWEES